MKIKKVEGYEPGYPAKKGTAAKAGAVAAAALIAAGAMAGCTPRYSGGMQYETPEPTEVIELAGEPTVDETEVILDGDVMVDSTDTAGYDDVGISGNIMPDPSGN